MSQVQCFVAQVCSVFRLQVCYIAAASLQPILLHYRCFFLDVVVVQVFLTVVCAVVESCGAALVACECHVACVWPAGVVVITSMACCMCS